MSAEDYEIFKVLKKERQAEGGKNRLTAEQQLSQAAVIAYKAGLLLKMHTETHYSLECRRDNWRINIYPGNRRICADRSRSRAPYIELGDLEWTLLDVVNKAAELVSQKAQ